MRRKIITFAMGIFVMCIPALAAADSQIPVQPSMEQLLAREAFLKAQTDSASVACVVKTSVSSTRVGELFMLWWGSYGSDGIGWSPTGAYTIVTSKKGTYEYKFTFRAQDGISATCRTTVSVS